MARSAAWLLVLITATLSVFACDPGHEITYVNETNSQIEILVDGASEAIIAPRAEKGVNTLKFPGAALFEAKAPDGAILFSEGLTWAKLKERGFRIIVSDADAR